MAKSPKALVEGKVLAWARESAGLSVEDVARRLNQSISKVQDWEAGGSAPTIKQLQKLAGVYRRPPAVLYLSEPPVDFMPLRDFRRLPGVGIQRISADLTYQLRRAQEMREIAIELMAEVGQEPSKISAEASLKDDPEQVGTLIRSFLGVQRADIAALPNSPYDTFNYWRAVIERAGVLVFQASGISVSEMRGFSIAEPIAPVIVVNTSDSPNGRAFTLIHEFAHLLLRQSGICDLDEDHRPPEESALEVFCNAAAAAALVPKAELLADPAVAGKGKNNTWGDLELSDISRRFHVSREVILRRLLSFNRTTLRFYKEKRLQFLEEYEARRKTGGFAPPSTMTIAVAGKPYIRLVLQNYHQEKISLNAVSDYLGVRVKHLPKIESMVW